MTNLKKVLVIAVVFAMMLSFSVSAAGFPDVDQNASYAESVSILSSLELMIGDEQGNFNPDKTITRAEAATIIVRAKGLEDAAAGAKGATQFTDVAADHWAAGYINLATQNGIIVGYGDGTFGPEDEVTYEQITKMIVATLGYTPMANQQGGYPTGYLVIASQKGISKGTSGQAGEPAPRATVARLLYNALTVEMMGQTVYTTGGEEYEMIDDTLLYDYLEIDVYEGTITGTYATSGSVNSNNKLIDISYDKVNGVKEIDTVKAEEGKTGAAAYLGYYVVAYVGIDEDTDEETLLAVAPKSNKNQLITVDYSQLEDDKDDDITTVSYLAKSTDRSATKIELTNTNNFYYNGKKDFANAEEFLTQYENPSNPKPGTVTFLDNGNDDDYDYVFVTEYTENYVVDEVDAKRQRLVDKNGSNIPIDLDDEDVIYTFCFADGTPASYEDIEVDNVLTFATSDDEDLVTVYISDKTVEGSVSESRTDGENYYTIDGEEYRLSNDVSLKVADEGKFYINVDNRIVYKETTVNKSVDKFAYLYKAAFSKGIDAGVQVQFITAAGEWKILDLATKVTVYKDIAGKYSSEPIESTKEGEDLGLYIVDETKTDGVDYTQQIFKYDTNSAGKIYRIYLTSALKYEEDGPSIDGAAREASYNASQVKLGGTYLLEDTIVFNVPENGIATDDSDITVSTVSKTFKEVGQYDADFYDIDDDYPSVVVAFGAKGAIDDSTRLFVISKVTSGYNDNDTTVDRFYGYQEGEYVDAYGSEEVIKYTDAEGNELTGENASVQAGDVVIFSLDLYGDIDKIQILMKAEDAIALSEDQENAYDYTFAGLGDEDAGMNYFGWAESKSNNRLNLYFGKDAEDKDITESIMFKGNYNVYNVNLNRSTPVVSVSDFGDIDHGVVRPGKNTDYVFVRTYEGNVVDAVVYTFELDSIAD